MYREILDRRMKVLNKAELITEYFFASRFDGLFTKEEESDMDYFYAKYDGNNLILYAYNQDPHNGDEFSFSKKVDVEDNLLKNLFDKITLLALKEKISKQIMDNLIQERLEKDNLI